LGDKLIPSQGRWGCFIVARLKPMYFPITDFNYWAILLAALINFGLSFLWFSPALLGKIWLKEREMRPEELGRYFKPICVWGTFFSGFITALILNAVIELAEVKDPLIGANLGFLIAAGFILPAILTRYLYENKSLKMFLISSAHQLITLMAMGMALAVFKIPK